MTRVPVFSAKGLSKTFPPDIEVIRDLSLEIYAGDCLVIAGANGSGKTVLVRLLLGLLEASAGEIYFEGQALKKAYEALRRKAGLVFQDADAQILGETVAMDAAFGPKNLRLDRAGARVEAALAAMGLADKRDYPPRRLSGGEKRRLALAGILAMGCETVVMDEPFANLDWPGVVQTLTAIRQFKADGKTLVILTHELEKCLALADRLLILEKGVIRDDGPPGEVLDRLDPAWGVRDPRWAYRTVEDCSWLLP